MARFSTLDAATEAALLSRATGRSDERDRAFRQLFLALREPVLGLCLPLAGSRADAEDAVQETFAAVYQALPRFRGGSRLTTWVYRIAVNSALRVNARRATRDKVSAAIQAAGEPQVDAPEGEMMVLRAMQRLSAENRTTLALFAIEGLSHAEIAETLGVPVGTVWSRLHAARKSLAAVLESEPAAPPTGTPGNSPRR